MLIITKQDIQKIFNMRMAISASKEALQLFSENKSIVPLRSILPIKHYDAQCLFMPAYIEKLNIAGVKIVSVFPKNNKLNRPSIYGEMLLIDATTGEVCAMLDGAYLTQLRTGALQGAATDLLAKKNATQAVLIGTGAQASSQLEALLTVRNLSHVSVIDRDFAKAKEFAMQMKNKFSHLNTEIVATDEADKAIAQADVVTTITTSKVPVFSAEFIQPGTHINGIGAFTPDMQEIPAEIITHADKIYFDTKEGVLAEAGDILIPLQNHQLTENDFNGELGEVIAGKIKGRESDREITIFKAVGTAVLDVVTAFYIYQEALKQNIGTSLTESIETITA